MGNGTWSSISADASRLRSPRYFSSAVLADGRVVVIGGEYNISLRERLVETNLGAIYDPKANTWTTLSAPSGWYTQ